MPAVKISGAEMAEKLIKGHKPWPKRFLEVSDVYKGGGEMWQFHFAYSYGKGRGVKRLGCSGKKYDKVVWHQNKQVMCEKRR
jgi:hypothetical protein